MMRYEKINQQNLNSLGNKNLSDFIVKCCEPIERKRMGVEEFQNFSFWKNYEKQNITSIKAI